MGAPYASLFFASLFSAVPRPRSLIGCTLNHGRFGKSLNHVIDRDSEYSESEFVVVVVDFLTDVL